MLSPAKHLLVRDWQQDVINLVQFPRMKCIPTASPFAFKLETFLKFAKLPYKNISNELKWGSAKSQIPFIELNGRQHGDSNDIIDYLINEYKLTIDEGLDPKQLADKRAYTFLIEQSLFKCVMYFRLRDPSWIFSSDKGAADNLTGIKKFAATKFGSIPFKRMLERALHSHGYGRNTIEEIVDIAKKDLIALNTLLNGKKYFFGDEPTSFDATVFGVLTQLIYPPQPVDTVKVFIDTETSDLKAYIERIKNEYWPEWDEITQNLLMNAKSPEEKAAEAAVKAEKEAKEAAEKAAQAQQEAVQAVEATVVHETALDKNEI